MQSLLPAHHLLVYDRSSEYEVGTICHRRFHQQTWLPLSDRGGIVKCPSEFVFDHPCSDIAEWIRSKRIELLQQRNSELLDPFLEGYGQHEQLTSYASTDSKVFGGRIR